jgi:hypothetical protein
MPKAILFSNAYLVPERKPWLKASPSPEVKALHLLSGFCLPEKIKFQPYCTIST